MYLSSTELKIATIGNYLALGRQQSRFLGENVENAIFVKGWKLLTSQTYPRSLGGSDRHRELFLGTTCLLLGPFVVPGPKTRAREA